MAWIPSAEPRGAVPDVRIPYHGNGARGLAGLRPLDNDAASNRPPRSYHVPYPESALPGSHHAPGPYDDSAFVPRFQRAPSDDGAFVRTYRASHDESAFPRAYHDHADETLTRV